MNNKLYKDRDWLYEQYVVQERSARDLAKELHISYKLVQIYAESFGFPVRNETRVVSSGEDLL